MIDLKISDLEKKLNKKILPYKQILGLDIATRTGWATVKTTNQKLILDYGFLEAKTQDPYAKLNQYVEYFNTLINHNDEIIIEDCFFGINVVTLKLLARLEGIAYCVAQEKGCKKQPRLINASSARKIIGAKGNAKKPEVAQWIEDTLNIKLKDNDAADAIILAFNGVLDNAVHLL